jgi:hypothetical protein
VLSASTLGAWVASEVGVVDCGARQTQHPWRGDKHAPWCKRSYQPALMHSAWRCCQVPAKAREARGLAGSGRPAASHSPVACPERLRPQCYLGYTWLVVMYWETVSHNLGSDYNTGCFVTFLLCSCVHPAASLIFTAVVCWMHAHAASHAVWMLALQGRCTKHRKCCQRHDGAACCLGRGNKRQVQAHHHRCGGIILYVPCEGRFSISMHCWATQQPASYFTMEHGKRPGILSVVWWGTADACCS